MGPLPDFVLSCDGKYVHEIDPTKPDKQLILVADDDPSVMKALVSLLSDAGYAIPSAKDGVEALEIARTHQPDLIVSDLDMPRLTGLELLDRVRADEHLSSTPLVILSASPDPREALALGATAYVVKPGGTGEILRAINDALSPRS